MDLSPCAATGVAPRKDMNSELPKIYLARHGETAWSVAGKHTGRTDIPLTPQGERNAQRLGQRLAGVALGQVLSSPLERARRTCQLAGFGDRVQIDPDLVEVDYGRYEGLRTAEIRQQQPDWDLFRDGCPDGESVAAITARADRLAERLRAFRQGDVLLFSHMHFLRFSPRDGSAFPPPKAGDSC